MELRTWKLQMLSLTCESDELITPIRTFRSSLRLRGGLSVSGTIGKSGTICILVFLVSGFLVSWRRYPSLDYWSPPRRLRLLLTSGTSGRDPNIHLGLAMELRAFSSLPHRGRCARTVTVDPVAAVQFVWSPAGAAGATAAGTAPAVGA